MSRTGVEAKLAWVEVPVEVRVRVAEQLGAPVSRGVRVWGGYGPAPTFRLRLTDGRRAFMKATHAASDEFPRVALITEERVYRELSDLIGPFAPAFLGAFCEGGWHVLLLEDLGPKTAPPWTPSLARRVTEQFATFHKRSLGMPLPDWLPTMTTVAADVNWPRIAEESEGLRSVAALAGSAAEEAALLWLRDALPEFESLSDVVGALPGPHALLHDDTRSDNLRVVTAQLRLFDWPSVLVGPVEFDVVPFAQAVAVEGGPAPEVIASWYSNTYALRPDAVDACLAWWVGFFADRAWRPDIPGLPRLRPFQRRQLGILLQWASLRLRLPEAAWAVTLLA